MEAELHGNFVQQLADGAACDALADGVKLPGLAAGRVDGCLLRGVSLEDADAAGLRMRDTRVEASDLAHWDVRGGLLERVEVVGTRLTGTVWTEGALKSVLFHECKMDFALLRMVRTELCVFEGCNLTDADFYGADLSGAVFRGCDLSRADFSQARLGGAEVRDCRLDGLRGVPAVMEGLKIGAEDAAVWIGVFGVKVVW